MKKHLPLLFFSLPIFLSLFDPELTALPKSFLSLRYYIFLAFLCLLLVSISVALRRKKAVSIRSFGQEVWHCLMQQLLHVFLSRSFLVVVALFVVWSSVTRWLSFDVNAFDFSIFYESIVSLSLDQFMFSKVCACHHFGVHPQFILWFIYPILALIKEPILLQMIHGSAIAFSLYFLAKVARHYQIGPHLSRLLMLSFLLNHYTTSISHYGFHPEVFFLPLSLALVSASLERKTLKTLILSVLFLSVKEDAGLYLFAYFAVSAWANKDIRRQHLALAFFSLISLVLMLTVVKPFFQQSNGLTENYFARFWHSYGNSPDEILRNMALNPHLVLMALLKNSNLLALVFSTLAVPFLGPVSFLAPVLLGVFVLGTATPDSVLPSFGLYYSAPFLGFLIAAWAGAYQRTKRPLWIMSLALFALYGAEPRLTYIPWTKHERLSQYLSDSMISGQPILAQTSIYPHASEVNADPLVSASQTCEGKLLIIDSEKTAFPVTKDELQLLINSRANCQIINLGEKTP